MIQLVFESLFDFSFVNVNLALYLGSFLVLASLLYLIFLACLYWLFFEFVYNIHQLMCPFF